MIITDPSTKACRNVNNISSAAAIVIALTSSAVTSLPLTCESKAKPILHALARDLAPADGAYQNMLQHATTKDLIPWLGMDYLLRFFISLQSYLQLLLQIRSFPRLARPLPTAIPSLKWTGII